MLAVRPHDLLRVAGPATLAADAPAWAVHTLRTTPWVVVRRGPAPEGFVAVGVRGATRSERYGTQIAVADVHDVVAPEALTAVTSRRDLPALRALAAARPVLEATGSVWGPTGSVGFELATGALVATADSDLDLLVRGCGDAATLARLHHHFCSLEVRVDCQVETGSGAVALAELVGGQAEVLVRGADGPRLVARAAVS